MTLKHKSGVAAKCNMFGLCIGGGGGLIILFKIVQKTHGRSLVLNSHRHLGSSLFKMPASCCGASATLYRL